MSQKNYVVEGKYRGRKILGGSMLDIDIDLVPLTKRYIASYTVLDEFNVEKFSSAKAYFGVELFGLAGLAMGVDGEKGKEYLISIEWKDWRTNQPSGETSVILIDDEYYKTFILSMV